MTKSSGLAVRRRILPSAGGRSLAALVLAAVTWVAMLSWWAWDSQRAYIESAGDELAYLSRINVVPLQLMLRNAERLAATLDHEFDAAGNRLTQDRLREVQRVNLGDTALVDLMAPDLQRRVLSSRNDGFELQRWRPQLERFGDRLEPMLGWAYERDGSWWLPLYKRLDCGMVVVVSLPVQALFGQWLRPKFAENAAVGLRGRDERVLLRRPFTPAMLGADGAGSEIATRMGAQLAGGATSGTLMATSVETDGVARVIGWSLVPGTQIRLLTAASRAEIGAAWQREVAPKFLAIFLVSALSFAGIAWWQRRLALAERASRWARRELQQSQALMRHALDASRDTTWQWRPGRGELHFDTDIGPLLGTAARGRAGASALPALLAHMRPLEAQRLRLGLDLAAEDTLGRVYEVFDAEGDDGQIRHFVLKGARVHPLDDDADATVLAGTLRDVSRLIGTQRELAHTAETLERMSRLARIGPWQVDPASGRLTMSAMALELCDLEPGTRTLEWQRFRVADGDTQQRLDEARQRLLRDGQGYDLLLPVHGRDGSTRWLRAVAVAHWHQGRMDRIDGSVQDVSAIVRAEAELGAERAARAEADARDQAKSAFMSRVGHELRTPLNAVIGYAELLAEGAHGPMPAPVVQRLRHIELAGTHLLALIDDVLDLSRIESGTLALARERLAVHEIADQALATVAPMARRAAVTGRRSGEPVWAWGDATRLRQVLINLLSNAVKYNRPGGLLRLHLGIEGTMVAIDVSDNGIGMDRAQLARVFEPFERLGRERSGIEGMGIGLAISRSLALRMQGDIRVTSRVGGGTAFVVTLPIAAPPEADADAVSASATVPLDDAAPCSVLCVDDDPVNGMVLVEMLRRLRPQWPVRQAETVAQALAAIEDERPDWLLLDLNLPDGTGLDLVARAHERGLLEGVRLVLCSADAQPQSQRAALEAGIAERLDKPVRLVDLGRLLAAEAPVAAAVN